MDKDDHDHIRSHLGFRLGGRDLGFIKLRRVMQGKLIAVVYTLRIY